MEDKLSNIQIVQVDANKLEPADYNPRKWDDFAIKQLTESVKRFGLVDPIIVNGSKERLNIVIGGHFRLEVAKQLGITKIPVVYVNISDIEKEKELNLRLNRNTGAWDFELLKEIDVTLLLDVGFDDSDLSHIWDDQLSIEDDDFDAEKAVEEIGIPKTKLGDLIKLGAHFLICGDATNPETIKRLVGENKINVMNYDPPYNINLDYDKGIGSNGRYGGKQTKDNKTDEEYRQFILSSLQNGLAVAQNDCHVFCWCDETYIGLVQEIYQELRIENKRVCLWVKNNQNVTPQIAFNKAYEPCVYGIKGKPYLAPTPTNLNEVLNKEISTGNRLPDDILDLFNIWLAKRLPSTEYEHPTQKPPTVYEKALRRCTKPGDTVLDVFGGSGTTLIACE
jgi:DNA modification methylase